MGGRRGSMTATTSPAGGVDVDEVELALPRPRLDRPSQPALLRRRQQPPRLDLAREQARVDPARLEGRGVEGGAQGLRGDQHPLDVHVEPAVHRLPDEVAAHQQDQHRRRDRHEQEDEEQLHAEAGPEDPAAPLHEHADEVPAEDEDEDEEQREVEDGEAEEQRRGQEVRLEVAALAQEELGQEEDDQQAEGHGQDQPDVVLEPLPPHPAQSLASSRPLSVAMNWSTSLKSR